MVITFFRRESSANRARGGIIFIISAAGREAETRSNSAHFDTAVTLRADGG